MKYEKNQKMRWKTGDYLKLEKAVNDFNNKINKLQKTEQKTYLPDLLNASEIKKQIFTKNELNRYLRDIRKFSEKGAENLVVLESGEKITAWENASLKKQANIRLTELTKELEEYKTPNEQGLTLVQMGNSEARRIQANIDRINELGKKTGSAFKSLKKYIKTTGTNDYTLRKATVYRNNYIETIEKQFSKLHGYKELKKAFRQHSNPIEFFDWIKATGNINIIDIYYESNQTFTQEQFYRYLEELGIVIENKVVENEEQ